MQTPATKQLCVWRRVETDATNVVNFPADEIALCVTAHLRENTFTNADTLELKTTHSVFCFNLMGIVDPFIKVHDSSFSPLNTH